MNAKDLLDKIKAVFNSTEIIPVPTKLETSFPVDGQQPVYIAGEALDINTAVFLDAGMTMPYPDGTYTITGGETFTVTAGIVTAVGDSLAQTPPAPVVPPAVLPQMPPMFETQLAAHTTDLETVKSELKAAQQTIAKHNQIILQLLELAEKLTALPVSDPKTLNERQQIAMSRTESKEHKLEQIAKNIQNLKQK